MAGVVSPRGGGGGSSSRAAAAAAAATPMAVDVPLSPLSSGGRAAPPPAPVASEDTKTRAWTIDELNTAAPAPGYLPLVLRTTFAPAAASAGPAMMVDDIRKVARQLRERLATASQSHFRLLSWNLPLAVDSQETLLALWFYRFASHVSAVSNTPWMRESMRSDPQEAMRTLLRYFRLQIEPWQRTLDQAGTAWVDRVLRQPNAQASRLLLFELLQFMHVMGPTSAVSAADVERLRTWLHDTAQANLLANDQLAAVRAIVEHHTVPMDWTGDGSAAAAAAAATTTTTTIASPSTETSVTRASVLSQRLLPGNGLATAFAALARAGSGGGGGTGATATAASSTTSPPSTEQLAVRARVLSERLLPGTGLADAFAAAVRSGAAAVVAVLPPTTLPPVPNAPPSVAAVRAAASEQARAVAQRLLPGVGFANALGALATVVVAAAPLPVPAPLPTAPAAVAVPKGPTAAELARAASARAHALAERLLPSTAFAGLLSTVALELPALRRDAVICATEAARLRDDVAARTADLTAQRAATARANVELATLKSPNAAAIAQRMLPHNDTAIAMRTVALTLEAVRVAHRGDLTNARTAHQRETTALQHTIDELRARIAQLERDLNACLLREGTHTIVLAQAEERLREARRVHARTLAQRMLPNAALVSSFHDMNERAQAELRTDALRNALTLTRTDLAAAQAAVSAAQDELQRIGQERNVLQQQLGDARRQATTDNAEMVRLSQALDTANASSERLRAAVEGCERRVRAETEARLRAEQALGEEKDKMERARMQLVQTQDNLKIANRLVRECDEKKQELERQLRDRDMLAGEALHNAEQASADLRKMLDELQARYDRLNTEMAALRVHGAGAHDQDAAQLATTRNELEFKQREYNALVTAHEQLQRDYGALRQTLAELEQALAAANGRTETALEQARVATTTASRDRITLARVRTRLADLQNTNAQLRDSALALHAQIIAEHMLPSNGMAMHMRYVERKAAGDERALTLARQALADTEAAAERNAAAHQEALRLALDELQEHKDQVASAQHLIAEYHEYATQVERLVTTQENVPRSDFNLPLPPDDSQWIAPLAQADVMLEAAIFASAATPVAFDNNAVGAVPLII